MNRITFIFYCAVLLCFSRTAFSQTEGQRHEHTHIDEYLQYAPMAANMGLGWVGIKAKHSGRERVLTTGTAFCVMTAIAGGLKYTIHEERPDGGQRLRDADGGHGVGGFQHLGGVVEEHHEQGS